MDEHRGPNALRLPEELAEHLGIALSTVHQYCREGRIDSIKVGKLVRIPAVEFQRVLKEGVAPRSVVSS